MSGQRSQSVMLKVGLLACRVNMVEHNFVDPQDLIETGLNYALTENLRQDGMSNDEKVSEIVEFCRQHEQLSDKERNDTAFYRASLWNFVFCSNVSEDAGLSNIADTVKVLKGETDIGTDQQQREIRQLEEACIVVKHQQQLFKSSRHLNHALEAFILTPDLILRLHKVLARNFDNIPCPGEFRTGHASATDSHGVERFFVSPNDTEAGLIAVCDRYNNRLRQIAEQDGELQSSSKMMSIVKLAATLFCEFVAVHPFSDGNGRIGRILVAHVLQTITPFLVTPGVGSNHKDSRKLFLDCVTQTTKDTACNFLHLAPASDFAALLLHALWQNWRSYFHNFKVSLSLILCF